jgi:invasion protein IalB
MTKSPMPEGHKPMSRPMSRVIGLSAAAAAVALAASLTVTQAQQAASSASPWVKLCDKTPFAEPDPKDTTKAIQKDRLVCMTHHERLDPTQGSTLVSAAIREVEGAEKKLLVIMLPLGVSIRPGMQLGIYPADMWTKIVKGENVDDSKIDRLTMGYTLCIAAGCTAEAEATPDLMKRMQDGAGMIVFAINGGGQSAAVPIPLTGFAQANTGAAVDSKMYFGERLKLVQTLDQNRKAAIEEFRKQNKDLQAVAPKGAAAPAPTATAAPAPAAAPAAPAKKP